MPVNIPNTLPARKILENENIFVMSEERATHQENHGDGHLGGHQEVPESETTVAGHSLLPLQGGRHIGIRALKRRRQAEEEPRQSRDTECESASLPTTRYLRSSRFWKWAWVGKLETTPYITSGTKKSALTPGPVRPWNPSGVTPTTVKGCPASRIVRPTISGSPPKARCQKPWPSIITG